MIDKLNIIKDSDNCIDYQGFTHNVAGNKALIKINEIIDVVNNRILKEYSSIEDVIKDSELDIKTEPTDQFAEERESDINVYEEVKRNMEIENQQGIIDGAYAKNRHLIGKLCKFRFGSGYSYGILTNIKRKPCRWAFESNGRAFSSCEPVKPDDDIIYKGGDNE